MAWRMRAALLHDHVSGCSVVVAEPGAEADAERLAADFERAGGDRPAIADAIGGGPR